MCIVIICCPVCDVKILEINHSFLIKQFSYITKKSEQKCKYLEIEKSFSHEVKAFLINCKVLSVVRDCLRPGSDPLSHAVKILAEKSQICYTKNSSIGYVKFFGEV